MYCVSEAVFYCGSLGPAQYQRRCNWGGGEGIEERSAWKLLLKPNGLNTVKRLCQQLSHNPTIICHDLQEHTYTHILAPCCWCSGCLKVLDSEGKISKHILLIVTLYSYRDLGLCWKDCGLQRHFSLLHKPLFFIRTWGIAVLLAFHLHTSTFVHSDSSSRDTGGGSSSCKNSGEEKYILISALFFLFEQNADSLLWFSHWRCRVHLKPYSDNSLSALLPHCTWDHLCILCIGLCHVQKSIS